MSDEAKNQPPNEGQEENNQAQKTKSIRGFYFDPKESKIQQETFKIPLLNGQLVFLKCECRNDLGQHTCNHAAEFLVVRSDGAEELSCAVHVGPSSEWKSYKRLSGVSRFTDNAQG